MLAGFGVVLHNRRYVYYVLQMGFAMGVLFTNISSSPFIMQQHYGFSAFGFSLFFGINALAIGLAAGLSVKFSNPEHAMFVGSAGMTLLSLIEFVALSLGCSFVQSSAACCFLLWGSLLLPVRPWPWIARRANSGTASALFGAAGFAFGGVVSPLVGLGNILTTTGLLFLVCSLCSLGFALLALSQTHASLWHSFQRPVAADGADSAPHEMIFLKYSD